MKVYRIERSTYHGEKNQIIETHGGLFTSLVKAKRRAQAMTEMHDNENGYYVRELNNDISASHFIILKTNYKYYDKDGHLRDVTLYITREDVQ